MDNVWENNYILKANIPYFFIFSGYHGIDRYAFSASVISETHGKQLLIPSCSK